MRNLMITVGRISLQALNKLLSLGFRVTISNPSANKRTPESNPRIPYKADPRPTHVPLPKDTNIRRMYRRAFEKGLLK